MFVKWTGSGRPSFSLYEPPGRVLREFPAGQPVEVADAWGRELVKRDGFVEASAADVQALADAKAAAAKAEQERIAEEKAAEEKAKAEADAKAKADAAAAKAAADAKGKGSK